MITTSLNITKLAVSFAITCKYDFEEKKLIWLWTF